MSKEIGVAKSKFLKEFVKSLLASSPVFTKKLTNLTFVIIDVLTVDLFWIIAGLNAFLWTIKRLNEPILFIPFVIDGFHGFCFEKKLKVLLTSALFSCLST